VSALPRPPSASPGTGGPLRIGMIVRSMLFHHASGLSRTDSRTGASGLAACSSRQKAAPGQSTVAVYPPNSSFQSVSPPPTARSHPGSRSWWAASSNMW